MRFLSFDEHLTDLTIGESLAIVEDQLVVFTPNLKGKPYNQGQIHLKTPWGHGPFYA